MSSLEGPTKAFREFFMMCYHHPKSVTIGIENVTSLQKVTHGTGATIIVGGNFNTARNIDWIAIGV